MVNDNNFAENRPRRRREIEAKPYRRLPLEARSQPGNAQSYALSHTWLSVDNTTNAKAGRRPWLYRCFLKSVVELFPKIMLKTEKYFIEIEPTDGDSRSQLVKSIQPALGERLHKPNEAHQKAPLRR
jgi:hypothetical protein